MTDTERLTAMHTEHAAWLTLCAELERRGAVTAAELHARVSDRNPLFDAIRDWGQRLVELTRIMEQTND